MALCFHLIINTKIFGIRGQMTLLVIGIKYAEQNAYPNIYITYKPTRPQNTLCFLIIV